MIGPARRLEVDDTTYHRDPAPEPSLSSSIAKLMLSRSALHGWHAHPRLGQGEREEKDVFDLGQLAHKLVLGKGRQIEVIDAGDYRKPATRELRDEARRAGKIPALEPVYANAVVAAKTIKDRLEGFGIVLSGESEVALIWQEQSGHGPVWARCMIDHVVERNGKLTIYDFKTTRNAHPAACTRAVVNYGYDVQQAAYTRAAEAWRPALSPRDIDFVFLFAEMAAPFGVTPGRLDDVLVRHGQDGWLRSVETFAESTHTGRWSGYASEIVTFTAPGWLLANELEVAFEED